MLQYQAVQEGDVMSKILGETSAEYQPQAHPGQTTGLDGLGEGAKTQGLVNRRSRGMLLNPRP